jgi:hypothetical protein
MAMGGHERFQKRRETWNMRQRKGVFAFALGVLLVAACSPQADLAPQTWAVIQSRSTGTPALGPTSTPSPAPTSTATPFLPVTNTPTPTPRVLVTPEDYAVTRAAAVHTAEAPRMAAMALPDLQNLPPTDVRLVADWSTGRIYVRFSNSILNRGPGPLELIGRPDPAAGVINVSQRIHTSQGTIIDEQDFGEFVFHLYHNHWHLEEFANYEVWSLDDQGELDEVVGIGNKVSYCVTDMSRAAVDGLAPEAPTTRRTYTNCWGELQGLSANWVDIYTSNLYGQWVEITDLPDDTYALVATVDPENLILEQDEDNNAGWVYFELANERLQLTDKPMAIPANKIK